MTGRTDTIKLRDGRVLGFSQYGDLEGKSLFYFHGWPASRLSAEIYDRVGKKLHIRIIAPDRPGFGLSDFQRNRTLLDWPDDVVAIANFLRLRTFAIVGVSGGGPYAAVCAYKIPNRITRVGIVVGLSPVYGREAFDGTMWASRMSWSHYGRYPWLRTCSTVFQFLNTRYGPSLGLHRFLFGSRADRALNEDSKLRERTKRTTREAFRTGFRGPELDLKLYTSDWGFDLGHIRKRVVLWYGADDKNVSLNMGKYYHKKIPNSTLTVYPGGGHLISITHAEEILKTLC